MRQPVFVGMRDDKKAEEAIREEPKKIKNMIEIKENKK